LLLKKERQQGKGKREEKGSSDKLTARPAGEKWSDWPWWMELRVSDSSSSPLSTFDRIPLPSILSTFPYFRPSTALSLLVPPPLPSSRCDTRPPRYPSRQRAASNPAFFHLPRFFSLYSDTLRSLYVIETPVRVFV
jgi:hypothetical protein